MCEFVVPHSVLESPGTYPIQGQRLGNEPLTFQQRMFLCFLWVEVDDFAGCDVDQLDPTPLGDHHRECETVGHERCGEPELLALMDVVAIVIDGEVLILVQHPPHRVAESHSLANDLVGRRDGSAAVRVQAEGAVATAKEFVPHTVGDSWCLPRNTLRRDDRVDVAELQERILHAVFGFRTGHPHGIPAEDLTLRRLVDVLGVRARFGVQRFVVQGVTKEELEREQDHPQESDQGGHLRGVKLLPPVAHHRVAHGDQGADQQDERHGMRIERHDQRMQQRAKQVPEDQRNRADHQNLRRTELGHSGFSMSRLVVQ